MTGPTVSLAEAAKRARVSTTTVRRWIRDGRIPGAVQLPNGGYAIPVAALAAEGLLDRVTPTPDPVPTPTAPSALDGLRAELDDARRRELDDLRAQLAELRRDRDRDARTIEQLLAALAQATRALPPAPTPNAEPSPRRRIWQRRSTSSD